MDERTTTVTFLGVPLRMTLGENGRLTSSQDDLDAFYGGLERQIDDDLDRDTDRLFALMAARSKAGKIFMARGLRIAPGEMV